MNQIAVIYWEPAGNTEQMANAICEGIRNAGAEAVLRTVSEISAQEAAGYERIALGCPAMGAEVLEEAEFEPFFTELEGKLGGKRVAPVWLLRLGRWTVAARLGSTYRQRRRNPDSRRGADGTRNP